MLRAALTGWWAEQRPRQRVLTILSFCVALALTMVTILSAPQRGHLVEVHGSFFVGRKADPCRATNVFPPHAVGSMMRG